MVVVEGELQPKLKYVLDVVEQSGPRPGSHACVILASDQGFDISQ